MKNEWWFFKNGFMDWIREEFPTPLANHFTYDMLENIIDYVLDTTETQAEFVEAMLKIVPEVEEDKWVAWINK